MPPARTARVFSGMLAWMLFQACSGSHPVPHEPVPAPVPEAPKPSKQQLQQVRQQCSEHGSSWKVASLGSIAYCYNRQTQVSRYTPELPHGFCPDSLSLSAKELALEDLLTDGFLLQTGLRLATPWTPCSRTPDSACLRATLQGPDSLTQSIVSTLDSSAWTTLWSPASSPSLP